MLFPRGDALAISVYTTLSKTESRPTKRIKSDPGRECQRHDDCEDDDCCNFETKRCMARSSSDSARACQLEGHKKRGTGAGGGGWSLAPGMEGFNAYCRKRLQEANLPHTLSCDPDARNRWYQETVKFLTIPTTPIKHLLVCHQLGTGKTITMLRVLDNYYDDTRPRLLLFPTETVAENFYRELATMPNRYRDWLSDQHRKGNIPAWPELDADDDITPDAMVRLEDDRQEYVRLARKLLATWPENVGRSVGTKLAGPLRTFSYEQGGTDTFATDPLTRWPRWMNRAATGGEEKLQIMDRMIILCDEAHNLLWPPGGNKSAIDLCRRRLHNAEDSVIVYMTATPVVHGQTAVQEARRMLQLVKGKQFANHGDEGFVSWYMDRPQTLFAQLRTPTKTLADGDPTVAIPITPPRPTHSRLPNVYAVPIDTYETRSLWQNYVKKRFTEPTKPNPIVNKKKSAYGSGGSDVDGFFSRSVRKRGESIIGQRCLDAPDDCDPAWTIAENVLELTSTQTWSLEMAAETAPKLAAMVRSIVDTPLKTLVLLDSRLGARQLAALLYDAEINLVYLANTNHLPPAEQKRLRAENAIRLQAFNNPNNRMGDRYQVAVAEAEEYGEGISFMHVRRVVVDTGYGFNVSWAAMEQRIGRALRSCSHEGLPKHMRNVQVDMFVAVHTQMQNYPPTIDVEKLEFIEAEIPQIQKGMDFLRDKSVDAAYYTATNNDI